MLLSQLLAGFYAISNEVDKEITSLVLDSRKVTTNSLFFALKGTKESGQQYISQAIAKGATAILIEKTSNDKIHFEQTIPIIPLSNLSQKVALIAAKFFNYPAELMRLIGITGTNGKTSCAHFIAQALQNLHHPCALIGTLGNGFYGELQETTLTTPDPITLQALLAQYANNGAEATVMEVSSHSIDQGRVNGIAYEIGIFTNLTQDHLDYHGTMQQYAAVKQHFIYESPIKHLIINAQDDYGKKWLLDLNAYRSTLGYSTKKIQEFEAFDVPYLYAENIKLSLKGITATIHSPWGAGELTVNVIGEFNLSNMLAVLGTLVLLGTPFEDALTQLSQLKSVPGRMQMLIKPEKPLVIVDYSHTPDSLQKALEALRLHTNGKLYCIFGCGGERDRSKRPLMASVAEKLADEVVVTSDNPRHENPNDIIAEIMVGFSYPERVQVLPIRSQAIEKVLQIAGKGDAVLIAGKGAEQYQQIGDRKIPFSDVEQANNILA